MAEGPRRPAPPELPARVRMPLLTLITQQSLDEDYLLAAERRAASAPRPSRGRPQRTAFVVIAVFGVLVSTAALQTSRNADVDDASRATLIDRIDVQRERLAGQQERIAGLRERNATTDRRLTLLVDDEQAAQSRVRRLRARTGFIPVTGEGVRVTLTNAPDADASQVLKDSDVALLVNALWAAGAEAIAVNGQRLTAVSAIRSSGPAIEVNKRGIAPPYVVQAIGNRNTLQADFLDSSSGLDFVNLAGFIGATYTMDDVNELSLPSAPESFLRLRSARGVDEDEPREEDPP